LIDLDKLATHLKFVSPKPDSIFIRNSLIAVQTRWQKILTRTTERTKELQKAFHDAQKVILTNTKKQRNYLVSLGCSTGSDGY
jgi:hypothetical protein